MGGYVEKTQAFLQYNLCLGTPTEPVLKQHTGYLDEIDSEIFEYRPKTLNTNLRACVLIILELW